jgi:hypothetical protein
MKEIQQETKAIETYSLFEFCQKIQESILQGFRFDFESNQNFPTAFGSMLVCGMVRVNEDRMVKMNAEKEVQPEDIDGTPENLEEKQVKSGGSTRKSRKVEVE